MADDLREECEVCDQPATERVDVDGEEWHVCEECAARARVELA